MSELIGATQNAPPVLTDGFLIHLDKMSGNGVVRAVQPRMSPNPTPKLMDISASDVRVELELFWIARSSRTSPCFEDFSAT